MSRLPGLLALAVLIVGACSGGTTQPQPAYPADRDAMTVVAAENFYGDLLHQLGGTHVRVISFLSDPNADPHEYESSSGNAQAVADARVVIENGLGYDAFMEKLLAASPSSKRRLINVQKLVGADNGANPHLWYDPTVMPRVARSAADALATADPAHKNVYRSNLDSVLAQLAAISNRVRALQPETRGLPVAFTEPVYGYMAEALGLAVLSPEAFMKAIEEGNDPPASAVAAEQDLLTSHQVRILIYNNQTETKITTSIRDLATRNGIRVVGVSETEPPGKSYQQWQLEELGQVADALGISA